MMLLTWLSLSTVRSNDIAQDCFNIINTEKYLERALAANQYVTGGTDAERARRAGANGAEPAPLKRSRKFRRTRYTIKERLNLLLRRIPLDEDVQAAQPVADQPHAEVAEAYAQRVLDNAKLLRSGQSRRTRMAYKDWTPSKGLVPQLGAEFDGRIKPSQLVSVDDVERELVARNIPTHADGGGWTPRADLTGRSDARWLDIKHLRKLLPVYDEPHPKAGFLVGGRKSEPSDEQDVQDGLASGAANDSIDSLGDDLLDHAARTPRDPQPRSVSHATPHPVRLRVRHDGNQGPPRPTHPLAAQIARAFHEAMGEDVHSRARATDFQRADTADGGAPRLGIQLCTG